MVSFFTLQYIIFCFVGFEVECISKDSQKLEETIAMTLKSSGKDSEFSFKGVTYKTNITAYVGFMSTAEVNMMLLFIT